jgi:hypothetical protein
MILVNHGHVTNATQRQRARNRQTDDAAANNDYF